MKTLQGWKTFIKEKEKEIKKASKEMIHILNNEIIPGIKEIIDSHGEYINDYEIQFESDGEEYFDKVGEDCESLKGLEIHIVINDISDDCPFRLGKEIIDRILSEFGNDISLVPDLFKSTNAYEKLRADSMIIFKLKDED